MVIGLYNLWTEGREQRGGREGEEGEKRKGIGREGERTGEKSVEQRGGRGGEM